MAQNWFKHDYNARNDDKLLQLRAMMGWEGYGLFFALVEIMCENDKGYIDGQKIGGLSVGLGVPIDTLQELIEGCLDVGLFYIGDDEMIHNSRVDHHVAKMKSFREAGKKGAKKRWSNKSDKGANRGANTGVNADKSRVDNIYTGEFEEFWELYDVKKGKKKAWLEWKNLTGHDKEKIMDNIPIFLTHFSSKQFTPRPRKYLYNRYWEDEDYQKRAKKETNGQQKKSPFRPDAVHL